MVPVVEHPKRNPNFWWFETKFFKGSTEVQKKSNRIGKDPTTTD